MSCLSPNTFSNVNSINDYSIMGQLEENIKSYLDWSFLNIGGFINVSSGTDIYGQNNAKAAVAPITNNKKGFIWETNKKDWVWETGVSCLGDSPISISGITVNGIFLPSPTGSGAYGYQLDYPNGNIIFKNNIPVSSKVYINHSYRKCQVYKSSSCNWWTQFKNSIYSDLTNEHILQTPAIVIEPTIGSVMKPYQLGDRSFFIDQDVLLYIFSSSAIERNNLLDIIRLQKEKYILMYDINKVISDQKYPLRYNGSINPTGYSYTNMLNNYEDYGLFFKNMTILGLENYNKQMFWCILRITAQVKSN